MEKSEGMYLIHTREMVNANKDIYKIGSSIDLDKKIKQYPNGSNILLLFTCINSKSCEKNLLKLFKERFIQKSYYGTKYFQGNSSLMIREICNYVINQSEVINPEEVNLEDNMEDNMENNIEDINPEVINPEVINPEVINQEEGISDKVIVNNANIFECPNRLKNILINHFIV